MENAKWHPCWCGTVVGILVIVFAWWKVTWGAIALTILGAAVVIGSLINKCCCRADKKAEGAGCCS